MTNVQLHEQLAYFWQQEDLVNGTTSYTMQESQCERHFLENVSQTQSNKYMVKLPVKEEILGKLGNSKNIALRRLRSLEGRFKREPVLKEQYVKFMEEYKASTWSHETYRRNG